MPISRQVEKPLNRITMQSDVIAVFGPLGSGKTTFVKDKFHSYKYLDLKDANVYRLAKDNPEAFFKQNPPKIILDEIQRLPELLNSMKNFEGQIVLISSYKIPLPKSYSIVHLLPFSIAELKI